jgi:hypothetical protein
MASVTEYTLNEKTGRWNKAKAGRKKRRKHNPELLRFKRAARALNIPWSEVTAERDRLRREELDEREHADAIHKAAAAYWGGPGAAPFWRGFFVRKFGRIIRDGRDYGSVPGFDQFVAEHCRARDGVVGEELNHESVTNGWSCDDVWDLLTTERPPLRSIWEHYDQAIRRLNAMQLFDSQLAEAIVNHSTTPF